MKHFITRATYADDYQDRNKERNEASRLEEEAYRKLATVDIAQAHILVATERHRLNDGQLKDSIRLDEAKLAVAIRELYPEFYKEIESLKAEQQLMAAEPGTKELIESREMALRATYADDYQDRNKERNQASHLEEDAYRKLATVDVEQENALGAAERNRLPAPRPRR
ncbi:hypothetical protein [Xylella fastidiosa]|uniref:hypothetical protein n=1 Tax=Xylella fastidiosa TaxID=2371 RepID=UPI000FEC8CEE|nr:hypothetical protein [Xylella fastidiosa]MRU28309.1 hypothetical protein [Xylella fastidiosa subsp. multiplex]MRU30699.1 hypothetical protein [Xylella fastidiosa subsp. multiplex]UIT53427.1 hypothetical protein LZ753_11380 [Xylella fastidiosa subsp. fastidiosa]WLE28570.1 hypothetical protein DVS74_011640 [Xylella fastidiosa subsp. multiplex]